jgi:quercetin dioxygenase-like cupin family protein
MQMRKSITIGLFTAGAVFGIALSQVIFAQTAAYQTREVIRTDLKNLPGQEAIIFASEWQPGFRLPLHMHPDGHEFTYVIEGEQTFEIEGVGQKVVKAGEVLYTPPNTAHYGRNATDKLSKTIVVRIKDKSQPISVEIKR